MIQNLFCDRADARIINRVLSLGSIAPGSEDVEIVSFETEAELLAAFVATVAESDADFIVGYNPCRLHHNT